MLSIYVTKVPKPSRRKDPSFKSIRAEAQREANRAQGVHDERHAHQSLNNAIKRVTK